jgi:hypothetical protein
MPSFLLRSSFLNPFKDFLAMPEGSQPAQQAHDKVRNSMTIFMNFVKQVQRNVKKGDLMMEQMMVRGQNSWN